MLFYNLDDSTFFLYHAAPPGKAGIVIDRYVDTIAETGISHLMVNLNARRTNYRGQVWDAFWDGYDRDASNAQPFFYGMPPEDIPAYRRMVDNMLEIHQQGIDYPDRIIRRCRTDQVSPWISVRMNDCHYNHLPAHPFHGRFWREHTLLTRKNDPGYFSSCLDYAQSKVREHYFLLIQELLDRYDVDGLELDFMREATLFSRGQEAHGAPILTDWLGKIKRLLASVGARRGHTVKLGVRVPSHPVAALGLGLDVPAWLRLNLLDLLVVTPRWASLEFDMPMTQWRQFPGASDIVLAGGLEALYRPCMDDDPTPVTPDLAAGAALAVLSQGADAVYLFNYFQDALWPPAVYRQTLQAMTSIEQVESMPCRIGVTGRDVISPKEIYKPPLPAHGKDLSFRLCCPPRQEMGQARISVAAVMPTEETRPKLFVNDKPCSCESEQNENGVRIFNFSTPPSMESVAGYIQVDVISASQAITVRRVELHFPPNPL